MSQGQGGLLSGVVEEIPVVHVGILAAAVLNRQSCECAALEGYLLPFNGAAVSLRFNQLEDVRVCAITLPPINANV